MSEYWNKTIELYTGFIDYPQMVPKHLKRPPFKYIFTIFFETHKKTNFSEGLFTEEELSKDYYQSPDQKMQFLKKLFQFLYSVLNKPIPLKPQSIIKGIESDKTNIFLQDMYEVAVSGVKFSDAKKEEKSQEKQETKENVNESPQKLVTKKSASKKKISKKLSKEKSLKKQDSKIEQQNGQIVQNIVNDAKEDKKILKKEEVKQVQSIKMGNLNQKFQNNSLEDVEQGRIYTVDELQKFIQQICQYANPLGKLVEYIDDDIESMHHENLKWSQNYEETIQKLEKMESEQDEEFKNYYEKLQELKEQIFEQKNKNCVIKSKIQKNDKKIEELLNNLIQIQIKIYLFFYNILQFNQHISSPS